MDAATSGSIRKHDSHLKYSLGFQTKKWTNWWLVFPKGGMWGWWYIGVLLYNGSLQCDKNGPSNWNLMQQLPQSLSQFIFSILLVGIYIISAPKGVCFACISIMSRDLTSHGWQWKWIKGEISTLLGNVAEWHLWLGMEVWDKYSAG